MPLGAYTSLASVKTTLGITGTGSDTFLTRLITEISAAFDTFAFGTGPNRFFGNTVEIRYFDGGVEAIPVDILINDALTKRQDPSLLVFEDGVKLILQVIAPVGDDSEGVFIGPYPDNTLRRLAGHDNFDATFAKGTRNIRVQISPAFDDAPLDINHAMDEEVARAFKNANTNSGDGGALGITQRTPDAGTVLSYGPDDWTLATLRLLNGYKKRLRFY